MQSCQSLKGVFSPIALILLILTILGVFDGGSTLNPNSFAKRVNEGFTKLAARDQYCCSATIDMVLSPQVPWVKQCFIEEACAKPLFFWVGLVMFFNLMKW